MIASITCKPVPTAKASRPSLAVSARSAMATVTDSGSAHSGTPSSPVGDDGVTTPASSVLFFFGVTRPVPARVVLV